MPYGSISRHPSYNNRFRRSSNIALPIPEESESGREDNVHRVSETASSNGNTAPRSPDPAMTANARRARFIEGRSMSGSSKPLRKSTDSGTDDVFLSLDIEDNDVITDPVEVIKMAEKHQAGSTRSNISSKPVVTNPYNKFNNRIHSFFWCTCCLYFVFICCLPGVHYMQESDQAFTDGNDKKAQRLGKMSSLMFIAGALFSVACYAAILFVVIFFTAFN